MTLSLIRSFNLLRDLVVIPPRRATRQELLSFHSTDYLNYCDEASKTQDKEKFQRLDDDEEARFGLEYDCPILDDINGLIAWLGGGSLAAAEALTSGGKVKKVINWGGGWHHSQRDHASGFCYVNDVVLAIHQLRKAFNKVIYIDLDVHHGDGVGNAFAFTDKVFTFSMHNHEPGFFPGTGKVSDVGMGKGKYHTLNVPLSEGITDAQYHQIFERLFNLICSKFRPDAIVVQCGADCLALDPLGAFNLTLEGIGFCISTILDFAENPQDHLPCLFLGGGGYNNVNAAKCWTYLTSLLVGKRLSLDADIPEEDPFFSRYGPSFELSISAGRRPNRNRPCDIEQLLKAAESNLKFLP